jgi:peptidoglycan/xylan/chitin deacetylase (PgdA/CDA1 family)
LCYHGLALDDEATWDGELFMSPGQFRRRLDLLREHDCQVISLAKGVEGLKAGDLPPRSVVITFDDGFHNFFAHAAPLLREYEMPATCYVATFHALDQRPIPRLFISYLLWKAWRAGRSTVRIEDLSLSVELDSAVARDQAATRYEQWLRSAFADHEERYQSLRNWALTLDVGAQQVIDQRMFHLMTSAEIAAVSRMGVDVQLHTHRHKTPRDSTKFAAEVAENRRLLESMTALRANHFCYPSGDFDSEFLPVLRSQGVVSATTCETGLAMRNDDPLLLPRFIDTSAQSEVSFGAWLDGAAQILVSANLPSRQLRSRSVAAS